MQNDVSYARRSRPVLRRSHHVYKTNPGNSTPSATKSSGWAPDSYIDPFASSYSLYPLVAAFFYSNRSVYFSFFLPPSFSLFISPLSALLISLGLSSSFLEDAWALRHFQISWLLCKYVQKTRVDRFVWKIHDYILRRIFLSNSVFNCKKKLREKLLKQASEEKMYMITQESILAIY